MTEAITPPIPQPILDLMAARVSQASTPQPRIDDPPVSAITIERCDLCQQRHEDQPLTAYPLPGKFSHWFLCPSEHAPVPIKIHCPAGGAALDQELCEVLNKAHESGQWLAAVFYITGQDERGNPVYQRYWRREHFPAGPVPDCARWLADDFADKCGPPAKQELKVAQLEPTLPMFRKRLVQKQQISEAKVIDVVATEDFPSIIRPAANQVIGRDSIEALNAELQTAQIHDDQNEGEQDEEAGN